MSFAIWVHHFQKFKCKDMILIEYDHHNFSDKRGIKGRIYWAKFFAAPKGLCYDVEGFTKWYDRVVRWIRKEGRQIEKGSYNTYYLPDAWSKNVARP